MKILHIGISKGWNAQIAHTALLVEHQLKAGHEILLVVLKKSRIKNNLKSKNIDIPVYQLKHHGSPELVILIRRLIKHNKPDIIHIHGYNGHIRLWLACISLNSKIPVFISTRDKPRKKLLGSYFWKYMTRIIVPNELVKSYIAEHISKDLPVEIINPLVDTDKFKPSEKKPSETINIGMFARFDKVKGYEYFFQACNKILNSDGIPTCHFVIAGTNFTLRQDNINALLQEYDLEKNITVMGRVENIQDKIADLDIGVIASIGSEELSRIALEYMSCAVPVIATRVGGLPECVSPKEGILISPFSSEEIFNALMLLIKDKALRTRLGQSGRQKMIASYSPAAFLKKIDRLYRLGRGNDRAK